MNKLNCIISTLLIFSAAHADQKIWEPDYNRMHPEAVKNMQTLANGKYDLHTEIPDRMKSGQNGYLIVTTKQKRDALKNFQAFVDHKRNRGFNVITITEDDFGGGTGVTAALNIRKWLQANYQSKKLLYVLMLGNPHPEQGDVPFKKVRAPWREVKPIVELGSITQYAQQNPDFKHVNGYSPTDFFYVDLSGDWDLNKNGLYADDGDYGKGGIDAQWEVLVGRIPYYGLKGFSGSADVDRQLARIIRYENETGDLSWRHNMFYNGGVFNRDIIYYNDAMRYNGAFLYRQTFHGSSLPYEPENNFGHLHSDQTANTLNTVNDGRFGMAYFQGHGFPRGGGGMTSKSAKLISDKFPKIYASGACDVASPETPDNLMNSLLVSSGIAAYGGTRSVTACTFNKWLKHNNYYTYFYFGNSTGEALWRRRSLQSKDRTIGDTNFMINLYGDPSIVPMPQVYGPPIGISPGWKTVIRSNLGKEPNTQLPYQIRNNTTRLTHYFTKAHKTLKGVPKKFTLQPGEIKTFTATLSGIHKAKAGEYDLPIHIEDNHGNKREVGVTLKIQPKQTVIYEPFGKPVITSVEIKDANGKKTKKPVPTNKVQSKGVFGTAMIATEHPAEPYTDHWASRSDFSISFFVNIQSLEGTYELVNAGPFRILVQKNRLTCHANTTRWNQHHKRHQSHGPPLKKGWNFISVSVDRSAQKIFMTVDEIDTTSDFKIPPQDNMDLKGIRIQRRGNNPEFHIDELTAHTHVLSEIDKKALRYHYVAKPRSPSYDSQVNNQKVFFSWTSSGTNRTFEFQLADNPSFKQTRTAKLKEKSYTASGLKDNTTYFWRVNFLTPSGKRLYGETTRFTTSSQIQPINLTLHKRARLPKIKTGVAGYNQSLRRFVRGIHKDQWNGTVFKKTSGPSWLDVYDDGTLFTNYGAPKSAQGKNNFTATVTAPDGQSLEIKFTVEVAP